MTALISVDGIPWPEPSAYNASTSTIVDSGRNVQGRVIGAVVRNDVAKVEVSWRYLTAEQWARIIGPFTQRFYVSVTFFNQATAAYTTREMYISDRTASMWRRHPTTGEVMGWVDPKLSLVEV